MHIHVAIHVLNDKPSFTLLSDLTQICSPHLGYIPLQLSRFRLPQAMEDANRNRAEKDKIPYTMMRAASNYSIKPVIKISEGVWGSVDLAPDHKNGCALKWRRGGGGQGATSRPFIKTGAP